MEEKKSSSKRVLFSPHPKQEAFIEAVFSGRYSFLCFGGAMGGGKSFVCLATVILLARIYPKSKWCVIRESVPTLKRTTLETFRKIMPQNYLAGYNQQDSIATLKNGSQIMFMAEDYASDKDFDRFKGLEVNGFVLEQIEELNEGLLDVCMIRAGRHTIPGDNQPHPVIIANVNPTLAWPKAKVYNRYVDGTLPADWFYMPSMITDNPALADNEAYMSRLKTLDSVTYKRLIEGDWNSFAVDKPFLYSFNIGKHVIKEYKINPHLPILISFDFNVDPMTAILSQQPDYKSVVIFDEFKLPNSSTPELCDYVIAKYHKWMGKFIVTGDASGNSRSSYERGGVTHYTKIGNELDLQPSDFKVNKINPSHINSRIVCNSVLQNANFAITENCKMTIDDAIQTRVDSFGKIIKTKEKGAHLFDNIRYTIDACFPEWIDKPELYE